MPNRYDIIKDCTKRLLQAVGENPDREGLQETPARVARMYDELLAGYSQDPKLILSRSFENESTKFHDIVIEKDIPFSSLCEHHMVPFFGKVHIAYIPGARVVGLSKLSRLVDCFARRLQIQERLTKQIADAVFIELDAEGVAVGIEAEHLCMAIRGIKKPGILTTTSALRGAFLTDASARAEVMHLIYR